MADPGFRKEPGFLLWGVGKGRRTAGRAECCAPGRQVP